MYYLLLFSAYIPCALAVGAEVKSELPAPVNATRSDFDEESLRVMTERMKKAQSFVDEPRKGQVSPLYLKENDFQQGKLCGVNALYICLRVLGRRVTYREVVDAVPVGQRGANMDDLVSVARNYGLNFRPLKEVSPNQLAEMLPPVIAHFTTPQSKSNDSALDHYVVLIGYDAEKKRFDQIDPSACAHLQMSENYVARAFSGYCLALEGTPVVKMPNSNVLRYALFVVVLIAIGIWWAAIELHARRAAAA